MGTYTFFHLFIHSLTQSLTLTISMLRYDEMTITSPPWRYPKGFLRYVMHHRVYLLGKESSGHFLALICLVFCGFLWLFAIFCVWEYFVTANCENTILI